LILYARGSPVSIIRGLFQARVDGVAVFLEDLLNELDRSACESLARSSSEASG